MIADRNTKGANLTLNLQGMHGLVPLLFLRPSRTSGLKQQAVQTADF